IRKWPDRAGTGPKTLGRSSGIQHVPLSGEYPAQRGELAVNHSPIEIVPRTQILQAIFLFDFRCGFECHLPDIALNRTSQVIFDWKCLFLNDLGLAAFDFLARDLVPAVPNLMEQQVYGVYDLRKSPRLFNPFLFDHQISKFL